MNTNKLKRFAQDARKKLIEQVGAKLEQVFTTDSAELREKAEQVKKLQEAINTTSKKQVIDKVAYTWFNRLMALRFMDANDYQPIGIRVITPKEGYTLPELLDEAKQGHIPDDLPVKKQHIYDLLDGRIPSTNPQNEAYKELLIGACNHLNKVFPFLFERINDYTELLLPNDLISEFSIVQDVRDGMTAVDCQEVEIIGWLYQFYIWEKKDEVFASKSRIKKEDIPSATQQFTPRWIVEYMVQNTVGKLWLQNRPNSKLRDHMPYYIESTSLHNNDYLKINSVEEITLLDQACGSGHILVYGFELFSKIYEEEGYNPSEIPQLIIEKNLFGLEIDERASQLAGMALMMKARSYQRRVLRKEVKPNISCYSDLKLTNSEIKELFEELSLNLNDKLLHDLKNMQQATNLGSLIIPHTSESVLSNTLEKVEKSLKNADVFLAQRLQNLGNTLSQLLQLSRKYHCVVDNPPYMGGGNMNKELADFVKDNYSDSKADLMTCFMEAGWSALLPKGFLGMINLPSWLFLSSFENLRSKLLKEKHIDSLLHMGRGIFGIDWGSTAFVIRNQQLNKQSYYFKLHKRNFQHIYADDIKQIFLKAKNNPETKINFDKYREGDGIKSVDELIDENGLQISYIANQIDFEKIPGSRIGFWLTEKQYSVLQNSIPFFKVCVPKTGMQTGNNTKYTRNWFEISHKLQNRVSQLSNSSYWIPYQMGGDARKWYGNLTHVINWKDDGLSIRNDPSCRLNAMAKKENYFKKGISWKRITSGTNTIRLLEDIFLFDQAADSLFIKKREEFGYLFAFMNTKTIKQIFEFISPTLNLTSGTVKEIPIFINTNYLERIGILVDDSIKISKLEWNSKETSWDFLHNELIKRYGQDLEETYDLYQHYWKNKFFQLHKNEEELNRQFIEIYGLQEELTPDVPLEDITILKEETSIENGQLVFHADEVFAQFVSYAVGCMFGRYSLAKEGLILANQGETMEDYLHKIAKTNQEASFLPDDDNIIPLLDDEWFEDDIVSRFYEFLKVSFGKESFDKNLAYVEESLGKDMRKYFMRDFYNDHIKRYKKRPIYWMFSSPKGSFNVLIYMHRYTPDTLNQILNGYLKEYREKLNNHIEQLDHIIVTGSSTEQTKASKQKDKLKLVLLELQEYERDILYPLATERIPIDLDDGVLVNYNKFGKAIKEIAGLNDKATKKKVKEFDWINTEEIR